MAYGMQTGGGWSMECDDTFENNASARLSSFPAKKVFL
jgi:hypothetical protein